MDNPIARARTTIRAPAERVWEALTNPDLIKQYMAGAQVQTDWKEGSPITYEGEWNGKPFQDKGTILEVVPNRRLKSTHFSPLSGQPDVPENYHVVTYELAEHDDVTTLTVTQENNSDQAMVEESEKTWTMMLEGIRSLTEA